MNRKRLFTASYAHLSIDIVNSSVAMILTLSAPRFGLDIAQIGFGAMMYQMFAAMSQPIFGGLTDKLRGRWVGALGLLWTLVFFSAASFMPTYPPFITLLMIGGLGSGAFHAAGMVNATVAGGAKANTATSYFFLGGQLGLALGPLIAGIVVGTIGLAGMPLMAAAMLPAVVLMLMWMNDALPEVKKSPAAARATTEVRGMRRHAAVSLLVTAFVLFILLRSGTAQGYATLLPMYFQSLGYAPAQFGFMLSVFSFAGALGTLAGGYLGDRYNRRYIMAFSSMLATPFAFLMLHTRGARVHRGRDRRRALPQHAPQPDHGAGAGAGAGAARAGGRPHVGLHLRQRLRHGVAGEPGRRAGGAAPGAERGGVLPARGGLHRVPAAGQQARPAGAAPRPRRVHAHCGGRLIVHCGPQWARYHASRARLRRMSRITIKTVSFDKNNLSWYCTASVSCCGVCESG